MTDGHSPRRSPAQWQALIERQAASGLSQGAFCAREGAAVRSFQYWKRRLRQAPTHEGDATVAGSAAEEGAVRFAPLVAQAGRHAVAAGEPVSVRGWEHELDLGEGVWLRFRRGAP